MTFKNEAGDVITGFTSNRLTISINKKTGEFKKATFTSFSGELLRRLALQRDPRSDLRRLQREGQHGAGGEGARGSARALVAGSGLRDGALAGSGDRAPPPQSRLSRSRHGSQITGPAPEGTPSPRYAASPRRIARPQPEQVFAAFSTTGCQAETSGNSRSGSFGRGAGGSGGRAGRSGGHVDHALARGLGAAAPAVLEAAPEVGRLLHHVLDQLADVLGHGLDHVEDVLEHVADQVGHGDPQPAGCVLKGFVQLVRDSRVQHPLLPLAAAPLSVVRRIHVRHCITMYHAVQRNLGRGKISPCARS